MIGFILEKLAGSRMGKLYVSFRDFAKGYKTYIVGISMVARGLAALIDASEGTNLRDVLDLMHDPAVDTISEGFGLMTIRAAVSKAGSIRG